MEPIDIHEMMSLQLAEVEMLQSMFPQSGEFELDDPYLLNDIQKFIDDKLPMDSLCGRIGFTLNLDVGDDSEKKPISAVVRFSPEYPALPPDIHLTSSLLSRADHHKLSDELNSYIMDLPSEEIIMCFVIEWLKENAPRYLVNSTPEPTQEKPSKTDPYFSRIWIYSHHIYSKWKRTDIQSYAKELDLTGFCMPGKPGMIVVEGYKNNAEDYWHILRRMNWKKIMVKDKDVIELKEGDTLDKYRKFVGFEEVFFEPRQGKGRNAHMDRGLLFQFLEKRGLGHIFQLYFGVEGKCNDDSD